MPGGVVFLVCIPTLSYEHELVFGVPLKPSKKIEKSKSKVAPKVDLRLKEAKARTQLLMIDDDHEDADDDDEVGVDVGIDRKRSRGYPARSKTPVFVSMETVKWNQKHHVAILFVAIVNCKILLLPFSA